MNEEKLKLIKSASYKMSKIDTHTKNLALKNISDSLLNHIDLIVKENKKDIENAKINKISDAMIDRLTLTHTSIISISQDILKIIDLKDPINEIIDTIKRPNGLIIQQIRVPIGVIGVIYESRPNVTIDITCLCIKTNNVCILKGGKEAYYTNQILVDIINEAIKDLLPDYCVTLVSRDDVDIMLKARQYIDVLIPRGSSQLINYVVENASVPVIETGAGICHLYIDEYADLSQAVSIAVNAKIQRPSVCNAIETILVHDHIKDQFLPLLKQAFQQVKCYVDESSSQYIDGDKVTESHYKNEYNDYICNIKVVNDIDEAIDHINYYSSHHSDCIVTKNNHNASYFMNYVESACVYHNASSRFSDGGEFGFGGEVGISTQKLHVRGPIGLNGLTTTKYKIYGNGHIR